MRSGLYGRLRQINYTPPPPVVAPGQVTGLAAGTAGETSVPLSWAQPAGTAPFTYRVEFKRTADAAWSVATAANTSLSYAVTGLLAGTAYQFRVRAENSAGAGVYSSTASATTQAPAPSTAITIGIQGVYRGFWRGTTGSASPGNLVFGSVTKTLDAAFLQTDYSTPNGLRIGFTTTSTDGPPTNLFEYVDVEGVGRFYAADAQWFSGQNFYTWGGVPLGTWTAAGQVRRLTFKLP